MSLPLPSMGALMGWGSTGGFSEAPPHLLEGGYLVVEIGAEQGEAVAAIAREYGFTVEGCLLDYGGRDRVVVQMELTTVVLKPEELDRAALSYRGAMCGLSH